MVSSLRWSLTITYRFTHRPIDLFFARPTEGRCGRCYLKRLGPKLKDHTVPCLRELLTKCWTHSQLLLAPTFRSNKISQNSTKIPFGKGWRRRVISTSRLAWDLGKRLWFRGWDRVTLTPCSAVRMLRRVGTVTDWCGCGTLGDKRSTQVLRVRVTLSFGVRFQKRQRIRFYPKGRRTMEILCFLSLNSFVILTALISATCTTIIVSSFSPSKWLVAGLPLSVLSWINRSMRPISLLKKCSRVMRQYNSSKKQDNMGTHASSSAETSVTKDMNTFLQNCRQILEISPSNAGLSQGHISFICRLTIPPELRSSMVSSHTITLGWVTAEISIFHWCKAATNPPFCMRSCSTTPIEWVQISTNLVPDQMIGSKVHSSMNMVDTVTLRAACKNKPISNFTSPSTIRKHWIIQCDWKGRVQTDDCSSNRIGRVSGDSEGVCVWDGSEK